MRPITVAVPPCSNCWMKPLVAHRQPQFVWTIRRETSRLARTDHERRNAALQCRATVRFYLRRPRALGRTATVADRPGTVGRHIARQRPDGITIHGDLP